jgi:hypothetical protein
MRTLEPFDVTLTFCFTPGTTARPSPRIRVMSRGLQSFCAGQVRRYGQA